jgi:hypothetical protein
MTTKTRPPKNSSAAVTTVAMGLRVHSGWAALVVLSGASEAPVVIDRRRIEIADRSIPGSVQPYHSAEELKLRDAEELIGKCREATNRLAMDALGECIDDLSQLDYKVSACGVLLSSGRLPATLEAILASHTAIHTAEGEFYRAALIDACRKLEVPVTAVKERELLAEAATRLKIPQDDLLGLATGMGRAVGSPWRQDEKYAALIAWLVLAGTCMETSAVAPPKTGR